MRALLIPTFTAAAVALGIAGAQSQQSPTSQDRKGDQAAQKSDATQGQLGKPMTMTQNQLRQSLERAGFKNVTILDAAYLVQAQTEQGDSVMMTINPPSIGANAATGAGEGSSGRSSGSDQKK